jgi:hypothetical protein
MSAATSDPKAIFFAALEQPSPAERSRYLDGACGGDAQLTDLVLAADDVEYGHGGSVNVILGQGDGNFEPAVAYGAYTGQYGARALTLADFNSDGNGTATTGNGDYIAKTGTLTFAPGETTKTITITVKGDSKRESNETFYLDLFGLSGNSLFTKNRGIGTILNDD